MTNKLVAEKVQYASASQSDEFSGRFCPDVHLPLVKRYIIAQIGNVSVVDDILQDAMTRTLQATRERQLDNPLGYCMQVARNLINDHWRNHVQWQTMPVEDALSDQTGKSLEQEAIEQQRLEIIARVVEGMPAVRKEVFVLRRLEGKSRDEIATQLNLSIESVKKHITRSMLMISRELERLENGI